MKSEARWSGGFAVDLRPHDGARFRAFAGVAVQHGRTSTTVSKLLMKAGEKMARQYTPQEINDLRQAVDNKYLYGTYRMRDGGGMSRSYREDEKARVVEEEVRTWIAAGLTASDLRKSEGGE